MACVYTLRITSNHNICLPDLFASFREKVPKGLRRSLVPDDEENEEDVGLLTDSPRTRGAKESKQIYWVYLYFFIIGISFSMAWGSISFPVSFWTGHFGTDIWKIFVTCYNAPGLPILFLQLFSDERVENKIGKRYAYYLRGGFSLISLTAIIIAVAMIQRPSLLDATKMIGLVAFLGIIVGAAHGWLFSLAAAFPPKCTSWLLAGTGASTLVLLVLSFAFRIDSNPQLYIIDLYFGTAAGFTLIGLFCFVILMKTEIARGFMLRGVNDQRYKIHDKHLNFYETHEQDSHWDILKATWLNILTIFLLFSTTVGMVGMVTAVPSSSGSHMLPTIILYASAISIFLGNEASVFLRLFRTPLSLFIVVFIRSLMFPFVICYSVFKFWLSDGFIIFALCVFSFMGGYCSSRVYELSSAAVKGEAKQAKASLWLNVSLYVGSYVGLSVPFWLPALL